MPLPALKMAGFDWRLTTVISQRTRPGKKRTFNGKQRVTQGKTRIVQIARAWIGGWGRVEGCRRFTPFFDSGLTTEISHRDRQNTSSGKAPVSNDECAGQFVEPGLERGWHLWVDGWIRSSLRDFSCSSFLRKGFADLIWIPRRNAPGAASRRGLACFENGKLV